MGTAALKVKCKAPQKSHLLPDGGRFTLSEASANELDWQLRFNRNNFGFALTPLFLVNLLDKSLIFTRLVKILFVPGAIWLMVAVSAFADDKPVIYNRLTAESAERDRQTNVLLSPKYKVVDLQSSTGFTRPKPTAGGLPRTALTTTGEVLGGYVLLSYVITTDGRATEPHILRSTDERLNATALKAMEQWRFEPATLNGVAISTTASQEFNFKATTAPKGFEPGKVVLYQPTAVLQARVFDAAELANYIERLQAVCADFFAVATVPETLHVVVAIRPGARSRIWFVSSTHPDFDPQRESLREKLEEVAPCAVHDGPLALAISSRIAGGDGKMPPLDKGFEAPMPSEWLKATNAGKPLAMPDGVLDKVWPDKR